MLAALENMPSEKRPSHNEGPVLLNERVVWFHDTGPEHGIVRWIGRLREMGDEVIAGVDMDNAVGTNDGKWGDQQLFVTRPKHGLVIPIGGLMRETEFLNETAVTDGRSWPTTVSINHKENSHMHINSDRFDVESYGSKNVHPEIYSTQSVPPHCPAKRSRKYKRHEVAEESRTPDKNSVEITKLLRQLEMAIANGKIEMASHLARKLANLKVNCSVVRKKARSQKCDDEICINLFVEDRTSHIGPIMLHVQPSMTVGQLKKKIEEEFDFPTYLQKWILGKKLAADDNSSISSYDIHTNGCAVFLYLATTDPDMTAMYKERLECYLRAIDDFDETEAHLTDRNPAVRNGSLSALNELSEDEIHGNEQTPNVQYLPGATQEWACPVCTLLNEPTRPGCAGCTTPRPENYVVPKQVCISREEAARLQREKEMDEALKKEEERRLVENNQRREENYQHLLELDDLDVVFNDQAFECPICFAEVKGGDGITVRECLHNFCRECLAHTIEYGEDAEVKCPYRDDDYSCPSALQDREVRALVSQEIYDRYLQRSIVVAESQAENSFHCKTADCRGWCLFDDDINEFLCPVCNHTNCLTCQAIHEGYNCKQYQDKLEFDSPNNEDARKTKSALEDMLTKGEAMRCPKCQIIIMKKWGCDWLQCSMCKTEICWVTKGARWGPLGRGDVSGGCQCQLNGKRCHPQCNNCH